MSIADVNKASRQSEREIMGDNSVLRWRTVHQLTNRQVFKMACWGLLPSCVKYSLTIGGPTPCVAVGGTKKKVIININHMLTLTAFHPVCLEILLKMFQQICKLGRHFSSSVQSPSHGLIKYDLCWLLRCTGRGTLHIFYNYFHL